MIHLDLNQCVAVICILFSGVVTLYVTWFTDAFMNREQIRSLSKVEQAKAIPLLVGLITAFGMACVVFAIAVLILRQGFFR